MNGSLTTQSVVYCFGVGTDISFDLAVIGSFGCTVDAFDPTPRCIAWVQVQDLPAGFKFHDVGLSNKTEVLRFSAPPEDDFVSYTVAERSDSCEVVELPVEPLDELMNRLGHETIDLLKMDIEGSEYPVIVDMMAKGIMPGQICVEFHHNMYGYTPDDTRKAVAMLRAAGYALHYVSQGGHEYGFHRADT
ncbi:hypothetical protein A3728_16105 [Sulfitobacter sp. HI0040]|nr:hypothetical protein A3728_16105 [Sulfitobacter sp. HI0040]KZZ68075.1 hypothetical protein A3764_13740 [Sulfitobacter sp. HI0129]